MSPVPFFSKTSFPVIIIYILHNPPFSLESPLFPFFPLLITVTTVFPFPSKACYSPFAGITTRPLIVGPSLLPLFLRLCLTVIAGHFVYRFPAKNSAFSPPRGSFALLTFGVFSSLVRNMRLILVGSVHGLSFFPLHSVACGLRWALRGLNPFFCSS